MAQKFLTVKMEAEPDVWREQKKDGVFKGECTLTSYDHTNKEFRNIMSRDMLMAYDHVNGKDYMKGLAECSIDMLYTTLMKFEKSTEYGSRKTKQQEMDIEFLNQMKILVQIMQWMFNSASYRDGIYHGFDALEIRQKLKYFEGMCHYAMEEGKDIEPIPKRLTLTKEQVFRLYKDMGRAVELIPQEHIDFAEDNGYAISFYYPDKVTILYGAEIKREIDIQDLDYSGVSIGIE